MTERKTDRDEGFSTAVSRRTLLKTAASGAVLLGAPALIGRQRASAQSMDMASFESANIDWRQAEGANITIGVIPAGYFNNLEAVLPAFNEMTGINARLEMTPPGQIRQKAVLDLSSGTGTWASHAADPMYYPLYVTNGWVDPLDGYLGDAKLTDNAWFDYEDILASWRGSVSVDDKPYGIPYDGEATIQVYRKDVYDELGLRRPRHWTNTRPMPPRCTIRRTASGARRCAGSKAPVRTCISTPPSSANSGANGSRATRWSSTARKRSPR